MAGQIFLHKVAPGLADLQWNQEQLSINKGLIIMYWMNQIDHMIHIALNVLAQHPRTTFISKARNLYIQFWRSFWGCLFQIIHCLQWRRRSCVKVPTGAMYQHLFTFVLHLRHQSYMNLNNLMQTNVYNSDIRIQH